MINNHSFKTDTAIVFAVLAPHWYFDSIFGVGTNEGEHLAGNLDFTYFSVK